MKVGEIMTTGAASVRSDASLAEAARIMVDHRVSGLPVVDERGALIGIITEGDFLPNDTRRRANPFDSLREGGVAANLRTQKVVDVMTADPVATDVETPLEDAIDQMQRLGVKRLPVMRDGRIVGILSRADILTALVRRLPA
jgi:CBS domain-containing protein